MHNIFNKSFFFSLSILIHQCITIVINFKLNFLLLNLQFILLKLLLIFKIHYPFLTEFFQNRCLYPFHLHFYLSNYFLVIDFLM